MPILVAHRKFKRLFRAVCRIGSGRTTAIAPYQAHAIPVVLDEILRVTFSFASDPASPLGDIDVLSLILNASCSELCGAPSAGIDLFHDATWLANNTLQFTQSFTTFAFTAPTEQPVHLPGCSGG